MSHYETLGVQKDATPSDIKKAYRKKASRAHPDKGGSDADMARLNRALQVLEDPERRAKYDATGQDADGPPIEQRARAAMLSMIQQTIEQTDENVVEVISRAIANKKAEMQREQHKVQSRRERFAKRAGKIKVKEGTENLATLVIDQQLQHCDAQLEQIAEVQEVMRICEGMLTAYSIPREASIFMAPMRSSTGTGSTWWHPSSFT